MCCPTNPATFQPLKVNHYRAALVLNTLLWAIAIIGIVALATKTPFGNVGGEYTVGFGGGAALILSIYLFNDRWSSFELNVQGKYPSPTRTISRASESVSSFIERLGLDGYYLTLDGRRLSENDRMGNYNCAGKTLQATLINTADETTHH